jgi:Transcriptional regulatory protein, C terminal
MLMYRRNPSAAKLAEVYCPHCGQAAPPHSLPPSLVDPEQRLTFTELNIWRALNANRGYVVQRVMLEKYLSPDARESSLKVLISHIRRKTGETIQSVWGIGYVIPRSKQNLDRSCAILAKSA